MKKDYPTGPIVWRSANDGPKEDERHGLEAGLRCEDPSLTVQSFTEDADINVLARRFGITEIPFAPIGEEIIDTTQFPELRDILEARRAAANGFANLPVKIRKRFRNSPEELWNFLQDPDNADEAVRLGLLTRPNADASATTANSSSSAKDDSTASTSVGAQTDGPPKETQKTPAP